MNQNKINQLKHYSILLAEDETGIRTEIEEILKVLFKTVYTAKNGLEAKKLYEEHKPDMIITDIKMPELNGIELAQYIRKKDENTFIAIVSAHTDVSLMLASTELNLLKYIVKPITKSKLFELFDKFLDKKIDQNITYLPDGYIFYNEHAYISSDDNVYKLTAKEVKFLDLLLTKKSIVRYEEIEYILDSSFESQHHIRQFIKRLRVKLPKNLITNVQNEGYIINFTN